MKKIVCLALSLVGFAGIAQSNQPVEFTKRLYYKIEVSNKEQYSQEDFNNINYDHYLSKNNSESLLSFYYNNSNTAMYGGSESNYFVSENWMIPLTVSGVSKTVNYSPYSAFKIVKDTQVVSKLNRSGSINGTSCEYYAILEDINNKEKYDFCFCIDATNKINNTEALFPNANLKGLILSIEYNNEASYKLVFQSAENVNLKLNIDADKVSKDISEYQESILKEVAEEPAYATTEAYYGAYKDPLYTYSFDGDYLTNYDLYNYISPLYSVTTNVLYNTKEYGSEEAPLTRDQVVAFYKKESKSLVKNLKASQLITSDQAKELKKFFKDQNEKIKQYVPNTEVATDYAETDMVEEVVPDAAYIEDYDYYTKYQSDYKDINIDQISLAYDIDTENNEQVKQYAPNYCDNLKNRIPNFQNNELKKHVHNLTGQICDLYLYNNGGSVDYFGTINSMRKSLLEIEKLRSSLSQKDQKLLLEFIKILD